MYAALSFLIFGGMICWLYYAYVHPTSFKHKYLVTYSYNAMVCANTDEEKKITINMEMLIPNATSDDNAIDIADGIILDELDGQSLDWKWTSVTALRVYR